MTPALLRRIGAALWGDNWRACLSREVDVLPRTIRRWNSGEMPVPQGVAAQLYNLCLQRADELDDILDELSGSSRHAGKTESVMR